MTKISKTGYKKNSKDKKEKSLLIPGGRISMQEVEGPVWGEDNLGNATMMYPNQEYLFPGSYVMEKRMFQTGGPIQEQRSWLTDYLNSPKYKERLQKEFPSFSEEQINNQLSTRKTNLKSTKVKMVDKIGKKPGYIFGEYDKKSGNIEVEKGYTFYPEFSTIPLHELGHAVDRGGKLVSKNTEELLKKNLDSEGLFRSYYSRPTEFINRLQPIRYLLNKEGIYDAKTQDFNSDFYEKMMKNPNIIKNEHFKNVIEVLNGKTDKEKKDQFILMMNSIAQGSKNSDYPAYMQMGGLVSNSSPGEAENVDPMQLLEWGKYIEDPVRRKQHMKDVYFNILDRKYEPEEAFKMIRDMGAYGANRGGVAAQSATYGWGYSDVDEEELKGWANDYDAIEYDSKKKGGNIENKNNHMAFMNKGGGLSKFTVNYGKSSNPNEAPQGVSMDEYIQTKNSNFFEKVFGGVRKDIIKEEVKNFKKAQMGTQVNLDNPEDPLQPRNPNNFYSGPYGPYQNQEIPSYVPNFTSQYNFPTVESNTGNPFISQPPQQKVEPQPDYFRRNNNIADIGMAGMQTLNKFFNRQTWEEQERMNQERMGIDQTASTQFGNRGDYDINSGKFRPDQYTPTQYKKGGAKKYKRGGEYTVTDADISTLLGDGYEFEIID